jgi:hypothetical protein
MLIVAVAWIYVVGLMALTEPSVVAGIVTFLFYCVLPLSTLAYIAGSGRRKARRRAEEAAAMQARAGLANPANPADQADPANPARPDSPGQPAKGED